MGQLYVVGVGPGSAEWITLQGYRLLSKAERLFVPVADKDGESTALAIVRPLLERAVAVVPLEYPMKGPESSRSACWAENARTIVAQQKQGGIGLFLTLGDPGLYSTFYYTAPFLDALDQDYDVVPGISSFSAASARSKVPLVLGEESLLIEPGADGRGDRLPQTKVLMKPRDLRATCEALQKTHEHVLVASSVGMDGEAIDPYTPALALKDRSYFSLVIGKGEKQ